MVIYGHVNSAAGNIDIKWQGKLEEKKRNKGKIGNILKLNCLVWTFTNVFAFNSYPWYVLVTISYYENYWYSVEIRHISKRMKIVPKTMGNGSG